MADVGDYLDRLTMNFMPVFITIGSCTAFLSRFHTLTLQYSIGIPTIRASQKLSVTTFVNMSTVAALFSAVTASMLQFSWNADPQTPIAVSVNVFWFTSLVFSVSSAVNSLLGLAWTQAILYVYHFQSRVKNTQTSTQSLA